MATLSDAQPKDKTLPNLEPITVWPADVHGRYQLLVIDPDGNEVYHDRFDPKDGYPTPVFNVLWDAVQRSRGDSPTDAEIEQAYEPTTDQQREYADLYWGD